MSEAVQPIIDIVTDVNPQVSVGPKDAGTSLFDLGLDSLDHASVLLQVEEQYGIKIPDDQSEGLITIAAIVAYVTGPAGESAG